MTKNKKFKLLSAFLGLGVIGGASALVAASCNDNDSSSELSADQKAITAIFKLAAGLGFTSNKLTIEVSPKVADTAITADIIAELNKDAFSFSTIAPLLNAWAGQEVFNPSASTTTLEFKKSTTAATADKGTFTVKVKDKTDELTVSVVKKSTTTSSNLDALIKSTTKKAYIANVANYEVDGVGALTADFITAANAGTIDVKKFIDEHNKMMGAGAVFNAAPSSVTDLSIKKISPTTAVVADTAEAIFDIKYKADGNKDQRAIRVVHKKGTAAATLTAEQTKVLAVLTTAEQAGLSFTNNKATKTVALTAADIPAAFNDAALGLLSAAVATEVTLTNAILGTLNGVKSIYATAISTTAADVPKVKGVLNPVGATTIATLKGMTITFTLGASSLEVVYTIGAAAATDDDVLKGTLADATGVTGTGAAMVASYNNAGAVFGGTTAASMPDTTAKPLTSGHITELNKIIAGKFKTPADLTGVTVKLTAALSGTSAATEQEISVEFAKGTSKLTVSLSQHNDDQKAIVKLLDAVHEGLVFTTNAAAATLNNGGAAFGTVVAANLGGADGATAVLATKAILDEIAKLSTAPAGKVFSSSLVAADVTSSGVSVKLVGTPDTAASITATPTTATQYVVTLTKGTQTATITVNK